MTESVLAFFGEGQVGAAGPVEGGLGARATTADALDYLVKHHASHNATLREQGLERMTHDGLVAIVPVDDRMAERQGWDMPLSLLLDRLNEKCRGRVLRIDSGEPDGRSLRRLDAAEQQAFKQRVRVTDLYVELTLG